MSEKDKVAATLLHGEAYDPFGVAEAFGSASEAKVESASPGPQHIASEAGGDGVTKPESMAADLAASFEPSAAAGAINAVLVPPTSASGLEDGVEPIDIEKEKSDGDWLLADLVPLTETLYSDAMSSTLQATAAADAITGPGADLAHAQTTVEAARERNLKRQADGSKKAQALHIKPQPMSAWSGKLRSAFECDFFAPGTLGDAMTLDPEKVTMEYKEMKHCLQGGTRAFKPALLSDLPETAAQELEVEGQMVPRSHPSFQLALLGRLCNFHFGEARQFGGIWRLEYGTFNPPAWATKLKADEVAALEARTHPTDLPAWKRAPKSYTEQDIKKQVEHALRPDPATVVGGFWAPADKNTHWTRLIQTWTLPTLLRVYGHSWTLKELYAVWNEMPLVLAPARRGGKDSMKVHLAKNRIRLLQKKQTVEDTLTPTTCQAGKGSQRSDLDLEEGAGRGSARLPDAGSVEAPRSPAA